MGQLKDHTGKKYGRWTIIRYVGRKKRKTVWFAHCECGTEKEVIISDLIAGKSKSCGCIQRTHGMTDTFEYNSWKGMRQRCRDKNCDDWQRYGKRGIKVCQGWQSFETFFDDMGYRPTPTHSIDRIDSRGHYSCGHCQECIKNGWPANCRWASTKEQSRNTRQNRLITYRGKTRCVTDWAQRYGMSTPLLRYRLDSGWSIKRALTQPVKSPSRTHSRSAHRSSQKSA